MTSPSVPCSFALSRLNSSSGIIVLNLNVKSIVCGDDFRFGYKREGDTNMLRHHFNLIKEDYTLYNQIRVSTSKIKEVLKDGDVELAEKLLRKPYKIKGHVIKGNQIGRKLGYPTANIDYSNYCICVFCFNWIFLFII